jgi:hypothetical protein
MMDAHDGWWRRLALTAGLARSMPCFFLRKMVADYLSVYNGVRSGFVGSAWSPNLLLGVFSEVSGYLMMYVAMYV